MPQFASSSVYLGVYLVKMKDNDTLLGFSYHLKRTTTGSASHANYMHEAYDEDSFKGNGMYET